VQTIKEEMDQARVQIEQAQREYDYQRASELQFGRMRKLEQDLQAAEDRLREMQTEGAMLKEEVDAEDIALIVSKWTGIPATKLLEGEIEKLIYMEDRLHRRVVGQESAVSAVAAAVRRSRSGSAGSQPPHRLVHLPRSYRRRQNGTGTGLAEFLFDDERNIVRIDMSEYQERHTVAGSSARRPAMSVMKKAAS
jgi:ATP-dependent Clp protease ATP-binding subunit ClpB